MIILTIIFSRIKCCEFVSNNCSLVGISKTNGRYIFMTVTNRSLDQQRPFSLVIYLLIVFVLTWPFQIIYILWGKSPFASYLLSSIPMVMVTVATYIAGRYVFRDGFENVGWSWGKPVHYLWTFILALFIFLVPTLLEPNASFMPMYGLQQKAWQFPVSIIPPLTRSGTRSKSRLVLVRWSVCGKWR